MSFAPTIPAAEGSGVFASAGELVNQARVGGFLLALPMVVYGILHFLYIPFVASIVPPWIPWHVFWAYFTGASLILAGLAIIVGKQAHVAATLLGIEIFLFVLLIHLFLIFHPVGGVWAERSVFGDLPGRLNNAFKDFGLSGAAFIVGGAQVEAWRTSAGEKVLSLGRWIFAASITAFGILHFVYPTFAPGIPPMFPDIVFPAPGGVFWVGFTGAAFLIAGIGIVLNKERRLIATVVGGMILAFALLTWVPRFFSHPRDITGNWLKDVGLAGGALVLAATARRKEREWGKWIAPRKA